ncbi:Thioredoxin-related transmembrane protein 1 [Tupaia chinensis]|uniref:Thioredoxin-related transmembrane protein 1 n=1 Tax=Tupaia chinensis TaxID=246437 RepID=L9JDI9_TUPCH|nr:Thioredoxin-related transmembrane protein 1 [Tupaia chinensis]
MAPSGSLVVSPAILVLLLLGTPWAHGRRSDVRVITDENWRELLEGEWMIEFCKDGEFRRYQGPRTKKDFINFISEKEWKTVEPVSSWFGPGSVLVEEEQEADEEDVSEDEAESKNKMKTDSSQNAIRQRSVGPSLATDKS